MYFIFLVLLLTTELRALTTFATRLLPHSVTTQLGWCSG